MKKLSVVSIHSEGIEFENGVTLSSHHDQDCCEHHYLNFEDLTIQDFEGLEFDLSGDSFFRKIPDYGIELVPLNGHSVKIAGHGWNNGYYGTNLTLVISSEGYKAQFDITECQTIQE